MKTLLGCDEAGRGAVIGPLVIAGVLIEEKDLKKIDTIGVKDSKLLSVNQREKLYKKITEIAKDYIIIKIPAFEIDELRKKKSLNVIEAERIAEIIRAFNPDKAIVDAPQVSTEKFKQHLLALAKNHTEIIAENFADVKYSIVSAASILAKVERDREIEKIEKKNKIYVRTGYPHDEYTIKFLKNWLKTHKDFPYFVRKSWITAIDLKEKKEQKKVFQYVK